MVSRLSSMMWDVQSFYVIFNIFHNKQNLQNCLARFEQITLADRVRFFKESKEGIEIMCRAMEDMRNQTLKEGAINSAKRMLADGILTLEKIAEYAGLPLDKVKKLKAE